MGQSGTGFRSKVARRVFAYFVFASLIPAIVTSAIAYYAVERQLTNAAFDTLRADSKNYALRTLEKLRLARELLLQPGDGQAVGGEDDYFRRVEAIPREDFEATTVAGGPSGPGAAWLEIRQTGGQPAIRLTVARSESRLASGELNPAFLWDAALFPAFKSFCVFDDNGVSLFCPSGPGERILRSLRNRKSSVGSMRLTGVDEPILAGFFTVPLRTEFTTPGWTVVALQAESHALAPMSGFQSVFPPAIGLAVMLALWISYHQVRRRLGPLRILADATANIAGGDFTSEIDIPGDDELHALAGSLDRMRRALGRQFEALRVLADLDRRVLSTTDMQNIVEESVIRVVDLFDCRCAAITVVEDDADSVAKLIWCGTDRKIETVRIQLADEPPLPEGGTSLRVPAAEADVSYLRPLADSGAELFHVLPIFKKGSLRGIIALGYRDSESLDEASTIRLEDFGDRFAVVLQTIDRAEQLYRRAHYDSLTSLPNRQLFNDRLEQSVVRATTHGHISALLFIDLDHFKTVNDSKGHSTGDMLLRLAAQRIRRCVSSGDTVARLGGDEFTVILSEIRSPADAAQASERIIQALSQPFQVETTEHFISASIGITMIPGDGQTAEHLLRNADTAMYRAKELGRRRSAFFEERMNREAEERVALRGDLQHALEEDEFVLHYQPKVELERGRIVGAEALIRWKHRKRGFVPPGKFIGTAEETGLIVPIGAWVLERAAQQLATWRRQGIVNDLSVNVSYGQLRDSDLVATLKGILERHRLEPSSLELEITESMMAEDKEAVMATLTELRAIGFRVSIDDFGTGYSSFSYLTELSFDTLKIDKAFLNAYPEAREHAAVVAGIIRIGKLLGKDVIAEGVETEEQRLGLLEHGCRHGQGFLFSRPVPAHEFEQLVQQQRPRKLA